MRKEQENEQVKPVIEASIKGALGALPEELILQVLGVLPLSDLIPILGVNHFFRMRAQELLWQDSNVANEIKSKLVHFWSDAPAAMMPVNVMSLRPKLVDFVQHKDISVSTRLHGLSILSRILGIGKDFEVLTQDFIKSSIQRDYPIETEREIFLDHVRHVFAPRSQEGEIFQAIQNALGTDVEGGAEKPGNFILELRDVVPEKILLKDKTSGQVGNGSLVGAGNGAIVQEQPLGIRPEDLVDRPDGFTLFTAIDALSRDSHDVRMQALKALSTLFFQADAVDGNRIVAAVIMSMAHINNDMRIQVFKMLVALLHRVTVFNHDMVVDAVIEALYSNIEGIHVEAWKALEILFIKDTGDAQTKLDVQNKIIDAVIVALDNGDPNIRIQALKTFKTLSSKHPEVSGRGIMAIITSLLSSPYPNVARESFEALVYLITIPCVFKEMSVSSGEDGMQSLRIRDEVMTSSNSNFSAACYFFRATGAVFESLDAEAPSSRTAALSSCT